MEKNIFPAWHFDTAHKCDIDKLTRLVKNCEENINIIKNSGYKTLLDGLAKSKIDKVDFIIFLSKIDYYLNKVREIKAELGCHVISFNCGYKDIKTLRSEFYEIYGHISKNGYIKNIYRITHPQYNYILKGVTVDFRNIERMKQARYVCEYIEMLNYTNDINKLWNEYKDVLFLDTNEFTADNICKNLQSAAELLHKISYLYMTYNKSITKLLKRNECFEKLNPFEEGTYKKIGEFLLYIEYLIH
jgi:hypothetical protein